jgi:hypothetical protein
LAKNEPLIADDWERDAREHLSAAVTLARAGKWAVAYQAAGTAVECALKYRIMIARNWDHWPDRTQARQLYTHDLSLLLEQCELRRSIESEVNGATTLGIAWQIAKDWDINRRYGTRTFPQKLGRDMIWAVHQAGLVRWILGR